MASSAVQHQPLTDEITLSTCEIARRSGAPSHTFAPPKGDRWPDGNTSSNGALACAMTMASVASRRSSRSGGRGHPSAPPAVATKTAAQLELVADLIEGGLATVQVEHRTTRGPEIEVRHVRITDAGRQMLAEWSGIRNGLRQDR